MFIVLVDFCKKKISPFFQKIETAFFFFFSFHSKIMNVSALKEQWELQISLLLYLFQLILDFDFYVTLCSFTKFNLTFVFYEEREKSFLFVTFLLYSTPKLVKIKSKKKKKFSSFNLLGTHTHTHRKSYLVIIICNIPIYIFFFFN